MTKRAVFLLAGILSMVTGFCQSLKVEASYWDENGALYKVERKYFDQKNNSYLYVRHTSEESVGVRHRELTRQDTAVTEEEYGNIYRRKTKIEKFAESDLQTISSNKTKDTINVIFYKEGLVIGDTNVVGRDATNTREFVNKIKNERVGMILQNVINIKPDSLVHEETVRSYYVKGNLVKVEVANSEKTVYSTSYCSYSNDRLVCREYQYNNSHPEILVVDSLTWNKDTSEVMWHTYQAESNRNYLTKYLISKNTLKVYNNNTLQKEVTFLNERSIFHKLVANNLVYNDPLYSCELRQFETKKIAKVKLPDEQQQLMEYKYDKQKRITEQKQFTAKETFKRVAYRYE